MKSLLLAGALALGMPAAAAEVADFGPLKPIELPDTTAADAIAGLTDVWHDPRDPGWGVFLDQQGTALFAALFTHNAAGEVTWFVMSEGTRQPDGSFSGELYRSRGPLATGRTSVESVGLFRFQPGSANTAKLSYSVGTVAQTRTVERFRFGTALRKCAADPKAAQRTNFTSLWWNPGEPGWGVALSQQGERTFGILFVYDKDDRPAWYVMSSGLEKARGTFGGKLFRADRGRIEEVGSMSLKFSTGNDGVLTYRLDGADVEKSITRQTYSVLTAHCSS